MEFMMNTAFWSDVGLTLAARFALAGLILWMAKMMIDARFTRRLATGSATEETVPVPAPVNRISENTRISEAEEDAPKVLTLRRPEGEKPATSGDRERMRKQLMAYLEERTAGRGN